MPAEEPNAANQKSREKGWGAGVARQPPWNNQKDPFLMMSTKKLDGSDRVPKKHPAPSNSQAKTDTVSEAGESGMTNDSDSEALKKPMQQEEKPKWRKAAAKVFPGMGQ